MYGRFPKSAGSNPATFKFLCFINKYFNNQIFFIWTLVFFFSLHRGAVQEYACKLDGCEMDLKSGKQNSEYFQFRSDKEAKRGVEFRYTTRNVARIQLKVGNEVS